MLHRNTIDYIRHLTKKDKKTLSQKVLKVCEETGELAKVALPFDDAYATTHRFSDRESILEEVADLFLTSISIAYDLDFSDSEIEVMINRKMKKWADLQAREEEVQDGPIPFEIHVTVENADKDAFITTCDELGVKPIILDLQATDGREVFDDVMTSSVHYGTNRSAYYMMEHIAGGLSNAGFSVIRKKIETVPWHPAAPSTNHLNIKMKDGCYFETHIGVITSDGQRKELESFCKKWDIHLSRNVFKRVNDEQYVVMLTYRNYNMTRQSFETRVQDIVGDLDEHHFTHDKVITEFSIYDTKTSHDTRWLELE